MPSGFNPKSEIIQKTINEIKRVAPWSQNIHVKLTQNRKGIYRTTIWVHTKKKDLIAEKQEVSLQKCLHKTRTALFRQMEKARHKKLRRAS